MPCWPTLTLVCALDAGGEQLPGALRCQVAGWRITSAASSTQSILLISAYRTESLVLAEIKCVHRLFVEAERQAMTLIDLALLLLLLLCHRLCCLHQWLPAGFVLAWLSSSSSFSSSSEWCREAAAVSSVPSPHDGQKPEP